MTRSQPTAAVLLIGDELLSGRTRDINLQQVAQFLEPLGIPVMECRTVPDIEAEIVAAVNALRARYTYVFTTGGIGPTHDDITADAIAAAFGVGISEHPDAIRDMAARYAAMNTEFTAPRRRMARVPHGASLVANPVSGAPGFQMENVFTMAGVPQIARAMLEDIGPRLQSGAVVHKVTVRGKGLREGDLAESLGAIAKEHANVAIGSYPWYGSIEDHGVALVARSTDVEALTRVRGELEALARRLGVEPEVVA
ncbi:MAG: competence/damage-inducible protein A [Acidobacteria bacterium]|nr:competence/damage-inducible protein A [Acidobacteriota bacterium]